MTRSVISLVLRRMRAPLLLLISAYAIAIAGFVLIPGRTPAGEIWHMDFFHAFYFVSYMGTTIGFGEIPYPFSGPQRLWAVLTIYLTVVSWFYALGSIVGLVQEPGFREAVTWNRFRREVRRIRDPFYLICGYGGTGSSLVRSITERRRRCVVIDVRQEPLNELSLADLPSYCPGLRGDAQLAENLIGAGLSSPLCAGVVAVTNDDHANLQIAIAAKILNPGLRVVCRSDSPETAANMRSFGTDYVVDPYTTFADQLTTAIRAPQQQLITEALTAPPGWPLRPPPSPPQGTWIVCGYNRLGQALHRYLRYHGVPVVVVEADADGGVPEPAVRGRGTEAVTLREAGVRQARAVVAATDDDADNLSIVLTARDENPDLFLVARQRQAANAAIFDAARLDMVFEPSRVIAGKILSLLGASLLPPFLRWIRHQNEAVVAEFAERLARVSQGRVPDLWTVQVDPSSAPALDGALSQGRRVTLETLERWPAASTGRLRCVALLLERGGERIALPAGETELQRGDRILMVGDHASLRRQAWTACNHNALRYVETGEQRPSGTLWRWLARRRQNAAR